MTSVDDQIREQRALLDRMDNGETTQIGDSMDCKTYGCTNEATATMGPYAGLCDEHKEIAYKKRYGDGAKPPPTKSSANGAGFAGQIKALLPLAKKVDRARARLAQLPDEDTSTAELEEAIRRVQGARTAENLERLVEVTKTKLKSEAPRVKASEEVEQAEREFKTALAQLARKAAA